MSEVYTDLILEADELTLTSPTDDKSTAVRAELYGLCLTTLDEALASNHKLDSREHLRYLRGVIASIQVVDKSDIWGAEQTPWALLAAKVEALLLISNFRELRLAVSIVLADLRRARTYILTGQTNTT